MPTTSKNGLLRTAGRISPRAVRERYSHCVSQSWRENTIPNLNPGDKSVRREIQAVAGKRMTSSPTRKKAARCTTSTGFTAIALPPADNSGGPDGGRAANGKTSISKAFDFGGRQAGGGVGGGEFFATCSVRSSAGARAARVCANEAEEGADLEYRIEIDFWERGSRALLKKIQIHAARFPARPATERARGGGRRKSARHATAAAQFSKPRGQDCDSTWPCNRCGGTGKLRNCVQNVAAAKAVWRHNETIDVRIPRGVVANGRGGVRVSR